MILFLKSASDADEQMPLPEKLILIFKQRIEDAKTDQDRARAERDLAKLQDGGSADLAANTTIKQGGV
jgi:hypothetical protein